MSDLICRQEADFFFLEGIINEFSSFVTVLNSNLNPLKLDMKCIKAINSTGARCWVESFYNCEKEIELYHCSPPVIDQFNLIPEFINSKTKVISFFALFYCDACDQEEFIKTIPEKNFCTQTNHYKEEILCPFCQEEMQEDFNRDDYFLFLDNC